VRRRFARCGWRDARCGWRDARCWGSAWSRAWSWLLAGPGLRADRRLRRTAPATAFGAVAALLLGVLAGSQVAAPAVGAQAGTVTTVTVERSERTITVVQRALASEGARSILNNPNCEPAVRTHLFVGPPPGHVETTIEATRLSSAIAVVRVPDGDDDETIELLPGRATVDRPGCLETVDTEAGDPPVILEQGRTTVTGKRFWLEQGTDLARMDGPVALTRRSQDGAVTLEASADALLLDVRSEAATLEGEVVVTSERRVSRADRLELDEEAGIALLSGEPAVSTRGDDEVRGRVLRYDLETDEVVAMGGVGARFVIDLD
jgi:lipopolysaccharide export system protein LptA